MPLSSLGALVFALVWWLTGKGASWHAQYGGQLDAWIIARTGKSETARLHSAIFWLLWFLRWGLGLTIALSMAAWVVRDGVRALGSVRWLASALNPLRWLGVTALVGLGIALPWHHVYWRPEKISIGAEPWFVTAKLVADRPGRDIRVGVDPARRHAAGGPAVAHSLKPQRSQRSLPQDQRHRARVAPETGEDTNSPSRIQHLTEPGCPRLQPAAARPASNLCALCASVAKSSAHSVCAATQG